MLSRKLHAMPPLLLSRTVLHPRNSFLETAASYDSPAAQLALRTSLEHLLTIGFPIVVITTVVITVDTL